MNKIIKLKESDLRKITLKLLDEQSIKQPECSVDMDMDELDYYSFKNNDELSLLRNAIDKNKTISVAFVKKDGTVRHMGVRKYLSSYVPSETPKTDRQMNIEQNNDILRVVDINAYIKTLRETGDKSLAAKGAWRVINLKNVLGFLSGGRFIDLRDENQIIERFGDEIYNSLTKSMINAMNAQVQDIENNEEAENNELNESKKPKLLITESQVIKLKTTIDEQISSATLLRKLSRKSKIGFGKYKELAVQEILRLGLKSYLIYLYYNVEGISFLDDILEELGIIGKDKDLRIPKPGKNPELDHELQAKKASNFGEKIKRDLKKRAIDKYDHFKAVDSLKFTKGNLQRINQGR